jgi:uncharacterized protein (TIGR00730 family)
MNITVYGAAKENIHDEFKIKTEELGRIMAQRGHTLIFGGGKNGLMGAVARGMSKENGNIIGIAPKFFEPDGVLYDGCTDFIYTEDMRSRKALLEQKGDAIIVLPGGIGTYDEFFEVFTLNTLGRISKKIAIFNLRGYYDHLFNLLNHTAEEGFMEKKVVDSLKFTSSPEELFNFLEK